MTIYKLLKNSNIFKYLVALIPIAWIFRQINIQDLFKASSEIKFYTIIIYSLFLILAMYIQGIRWWILLKAFAPRLSFTKTLFVHLKSLFYSVIVPSSIAQDVIRTIFISKDINPSLGWGVAWINRIIGLLALLTLSFIGLTKIGFNVLPQILVKSIIFFSIAIVFLIFLTFSKRITKYIRIIFYKILPNKIVIKIENFRQSIYEFKNKKIELFYSFLITLTMQFVITMAISILIGGISGKFYFWEGLAFIPLIEIVAISFAFTPSGMGIREGLTLFLFEFLGLSIEQLGIYTIISVLGTILKVFVGISGLYTKEKTNKQKEI